VRLRISPGAGIFKFVFIYPNLKLKPLLEPEEKVVLRIIRHPLSNPVGYLMAVALGILSLILLLIPFPRIPLLPLPRKELLVVTCLFLSITIAVISYVETKSHTYYITNRRIFYKREGFTESLIDLRYDGIRGIVVGKDAIGKFFGYGTLIPILTELERLMARKECYWRGSPYAMIGIRNVEEVYILLARLIRDAASLKGLTASGAEKVEGITSAPKRAEEKSPPAGARGAPGGDAPTSHPL